MPNTYFKFKQFTIHQDQTAMKVGTDGVLLGAWVDTGNALRILDVGTGTGLIAIMLAQRSGAKVDAVEIDEPSYTQAKENAAESPWTERIAIYHESFQSFAQRAEERYDLVISNPPYFTNSLQGPEKAKAVARHTEFLPHPELIESIKKILLPTGRFAGIFPYVEGNLFVALAAGQGLYCNRRSNVLGRVGGTVKRVLLEFSYQKRPLIEDTIAVRDKDGEQSEGYRWLTREFYLNPV